MTMFDFNRRFKKLTGHAPFEWQRRLFEEHFMQGDLPSALDLPTGLGKTSVMTIWYLARQAGARVPRRLVYVVDRRAVVDQATAVAESIKQRSHDSALRISTLRGRYADNREWLEDPAAPAIIVGTVDMIGSRLLFEGYGVSRGMRPYHAGLLGADTLLVLDESHLVPPFERLLERIALDRDKDNVLGPKEAKDRDLIPRFRLLPLSATGRDRGEGDDVFRLTEQDREDAVVEARLDARKRLMFKPVGEKNKLEERLAEEAWALYDEEKVPVRVLIYCNSRDVAGETKKAIETRMKSAQIPPENVQLFVGARRVKEREDAKNKLEELGFFSANDALDKPAFVVATSAGEVGVDLDADHMVMDLVPFERMIQRLGRVNRLGGEGRKAHIVVIEEPDKSLPDDLKERAKKAALLLRGLRGFLPTEDAAFQAGPGALVQLKEDMKNKECEQCIRDASSPDPLYPALTRPLLDAWSMTSLKEHTGRPEVQPWLRGWIDNDPPQTTLVWRKFLPVRVRGGATSKREIADFFAAAPPHLTEILEAPTYRVHEWLFKRAEKLAEAIGKTEDNASADGAGNADADDPAPLDEQKIVAIALGRSGEDAELFTLDGLVEEAAKLAAAKLAKAPQHRRKQIKEIFERKIKGNTLILDARMGGLSSDGLFEPKEGEPASTPDNDDDWETIIGFRMRSIAPEDAENPDADWHKPYLFDLRRDGEGRPLRQLRVEKYRDATAMEEERSLSPKRAQKLEEHQEWAARKAEKLVGFLELPDNIGRAIVLAARLHDEGKKAANWQRAFSAGADGIYAKTTGPFMRKVLDGYRHEFGSLPYIERNDKFKKLPDDLKDLVLHLVAAHHGRARPVIETAGCADGPPSQLTARARDVALRFARLQKRFGPWGLAWLEAILRAADAQASSDLDEGRRPDG